MLSTQRIERLRRNLLENQAHLRRQLANLTASSTEINVTSGNHMAEDATAAFDQATIVSLHRSQELALAQVDQALERMMQGAYGQCERCQEEIDFARLKAVPHAPLCMSCQKLVEL
jgi:RNA polymerase-binding transcription factor DksA